MYQASICSLVNLRSIEKYLLTGKQAKMNLDSINGLDVGGAFRIANLVIAGLAVRIVAMIGDLFVIKY